MNKGINIVLIFILFKFFVASILVGFDLNVFGFFEGVETPYLNEIYLVGSGLIALILGFRTVNRWFGLRIFKHKEKFTWMGSISAERISRVRLYLILENLYLFLLGIFFIKISPFSLILGWVCVAGFVEAVLFILLKTNPKSMKSGLTKQALIIGDRDVKIFYFTGLRKVTVLQDTVYMEYKDDLTLSFATSSIQKKDRADFKTHFLSLVNTDKVFVSEKFKDL